MKPTTTEQLNTVRDYVESWMRTKELDLQAAAANMQKHAKSWRAEAVADACNEWQKAAGMQMTYANFLDQTDPKNWPVGTTPSQIAEAATKAMVKVLLAGADDNWSGRGNDAKRAYFEGVRAAYEMIRDGICD